MAGSPTMISSELPNSAVGKSVASTLITAKSEYGSVPTSVAGRVLPSASATVISLAPSITWLLVTI